MPTIHILYGFCEGRRVARTFRRTLRHAGWHVTANPKEADVLLAHSGGCFVVPPAATPKHIILVGLPYFPGKPMRRALQEKLAAEWHTWPHGFVLRKLFWNAVYFWRMGRNIRMLYGMRKGTAWQLTSRITVVHNAEDSYVVPDGTQQRFRSKPTVVTLPGLHDDIWYNPAAYLSVIQS